MGIGQYIKEIGRGARGAKALTRAQSADLMGQVLDQQASDYEVGAFCIAMRIKGETAEEMCGFWDAVQQRLRRLARTDAPLVVIPSYNDARRLPTLTPLLALLLAREGLPVLVHGMSTEPSRVSAFAVLERLGVPLARPATTIANGSVAAVPTARLLPSLARLLAVRQVIGLRNPGHSVAKLLQPCDAHSILLGSYTHPEYRETLTDYFSHEPANVLLARGTEGEVVADARRSGRIDWLHDGHQRTMVDPTSGSIGELPELPAGTDVADTAAWIRKVLDGAAPVPAPIATQIATIKECLKQATRVAWASPV